MAPSVIAFDWSPHCIGDESPCQAKNRHFSELRAAHGESWTYKKHGESWTYKKPGSSCKYPSFEQIYTDPLWYNSAMNCASLPENHCPAPFLSPKRKEAKVKKDSDDYEAGLICGFCTCKKEGTHPRCSECILMALEYIWFTFHPLSQNSEIFSIDGLSMIDKAIAYGWNVLELSAQLEADHKTDDVDETLEYNCKTDLYSKIYTQKRRFQELKHAQLGFIDSNGHSLKTIQSADSSHNQKEVQMLLRK